MQINITLHTDDSVFFSPLLPHGLELAEPVVYPHGSGRRHCSAGEAASAAAAAAAAAHVESGRLPAGGGEHAVALNEGAPGREVAAAKVVPPVVVVLDVLGHDSHYKSSGVLLILQDMYLRNPESVGGGGAPS